MNINWKVRFKNPHFLLQLALSIVAPVLAYNGISGDDLTTWAAVGELVVGAAKNPYVLFLVFVSVYNAITDPTTKGIGDSIHALNYKNLGGSDNE